jgi:hypothetical protein
MIRVSKRVLSIAALLVVFACLTPVSVATDTGSTQTATSAVRIDVPSAELGPGEVVRASLVLEADDESTPVLLRADPPDAMHVPTQVLVHGTRADFEIRAGRLAENTTVRLEAVAGSSTGSTTFVVRRQPWRLAAVTTRHRRVTGGATITGTVHVVGMTEDTEPVRIQLQSLSPLATVPEAVEVRWGSRVSRAQFDVRTVETDVIASAPIAARGSGGERKWDLRVEPLLARSLVLAPPDPVPGTQATATLTLTDIAPTASTWLLAAHPQGFVVVPSRVRAEKGQKSLSFPLARIAPSAGNQGWITVAPERFPQLARRLALSFDEPAQDAQKTHPAAE